MKGNVFSTAYRSILVSSSSLFCFNNMQLFCLGLSHCSLNNLHFTKQALINLLYATCPAINSRQSKQLAGKHSGALSRARYFSQNLVQTQTEIKGKWILGLHSSDRHKHDSKWMLMFAGCVCNYLQTHLPDQLYMTILCL